MAEETPVDRSGHPVEVVPGNPDLNLRREIRRVFPWHQLTRALGLSFGLGKILLALAGVLLLELVSAGIALGPFDMQGTSRVSTIHRNIGVNRGNASDFGSDLLPVVGFSKITFEPAHVLLAPLNALIGENLFTQGSLLAALRIVATIVIWGLFGGAIARIALVQAGLGSGLGAKGALRYAARHWRPLLGAPFLPILVLSLCLLPCVAFGLVFKLPGIGPALGGILLFLPMFFGFVMFVMVAGLALGWPLMVASVAAEGEDTLDALSRSFSYLNHRLGRYAFYLLVVLLVSIPGLLLVTWAVEGTLAMTRWGLSAVVSTDSLRSAFAYSASSGGSISLTPWSANSLWVGLVRLVPRAWAYSYFWTAFALIYLVIRKDVDGAEWSHLRSETT